MTDILFYHLEETPLERVLPVLLDKTLERGWRAVVECGDAGRMADLDTKLWTWRDDSFLAHGIEGEHDADQPVLLTTGEGNGNGAQVRFFAAGAVPRTGDGYERLVFLFDGHDPDAVTAARQAWKALREGNAVTYWQQDETGRWAKKG